MSDVKMSAAQFGVAMAKAIQERPYSNNWALAHLAVHIATGDEDKADAVYADMPAFLASIISQEEECMTTPTTQGEIR